MEKLKYHGHIVLEVGDRKIEGNNAITHLFEEVVANMGIEKIFTQANPYQEGSTFVHTASGRQYYNGAKLYSDCNGQMLITVYLLNLSSAEKAALNSNSYVLPIYSSDGLSIDSNKLIGFATGRVNAVAATKEGHVARLSGTNLVNFRKHAIQWVFDSGSVEGTFNTIAIGLNVVDNNIGAGVRLARLLTGHCQVLSEYSGIGQYFMIPNVKSEDGTVIWTAENEILLGGADSSYYNVARRVLNLQTGEIADLESTHPAYGLTLPEADINNQAQVSQFVFGDYWCQNYFYSRNYVDYRNIKTNATGSINQSGAKGAFVYNGYLYVVGYTDANTLTAYAYDTDMQHSSANDFTITVPTGLTADGCKILNYGSNFILSYNTDSSWYKKPELAKTFVFTDPANLASSIIGILPGIQPITVFFYNNQPYFVYTGDGADLAEEKIQTEYYSGGSTYANLHKGLKICTLGMFGNLFSFKTYEDQTIEAGQPVKVQYIYTFDEN